MLFSGSYTELYWDMDQTTLNMFKLNNLVSPRNRHRKQILTHRRGKLLDILGVSILGLADIINLLPKCIVEAGTVKDFQTMLQKLVKAAASSEVPGWKNSLSPRCTLHTHAVKKWFSWTPDTGKGGRDDAQWYNDYNDNIEYNGGGDMLTRLFAF